MRWFDRKGGAYLKMDLPARGAALEVYTLQVHGDGVVVGLKQDERKGFLHSVVLDDCGIIVQKEMVTDGLLDLGVGDDGLVEGDSVIPSLTAEAYEKEPDNDDYSDIDSDNDLLASDSLTGSIVSIDDGMYVRLGYECTPYLLYRALQVFELPYNTRVRVGVSSNSKPGPLKDLFFNDIRVFHPGEVRVILYCDVSNNTQYTATVIVVEGENSSSKELTAHGDYHGVKKGDRARFVNDVVRYFLQDSLGILAEKKGVKMNSVSLVIMKTPSRDGENSVRKNFDVYNIPVFGEDVDVLQLRHYVAMRAFPEGNYDCWPLHYAFRPELAPQNVKVHIAEPMRDGEVVPKLRDTISKQQVLTVNKFTWRTLDVQYSNLEGLVNVSVDNARNLLTLPARDPVFAGIENQHRRIHREYLNGGWTGTMKTTTSKGGRGPAFFVAAYDPSEGLRHKVLQAAVKAFVINRYTKSTKNAWLWWYSPQKAYTIFAGKTSKSNIQCTLNLETYTSDVNMLNPEHIRDITTLFNYNFRVLGGVYGYRYALYLSANGFSVHLCVFIAHCVFGSGVFPCTPPDLFELLRFSEHTGLKHKKVLTSYDDISEEKKRKEKFSGEQYRREKEKVPEMLRDATINGNALQVAV
jgi:hypothetical protein